MALSEKHRHSIYGSLVPILGEEETQAMLANFPPYDLDELVTKDFLAARMAEQDTKLEQLRTEMHEMSNRLQASVMTAAAVIIGAVGVIMTALFAVFT
jgi:hypothetical protein